MHALENRTLRNYETSEGVAIFVTKYSTADNSFAIPVLTLATKVSGTPLSPRNIHIFHPAAQG